MLPSQEIARVRTGPKFIGIIPKAVRQNGRWVFREGEVCQIPRLFIEGDVEGDGGRRLMNRGVRGIARCRLLCDACTVSRHHVHFGRAEP